MGVVQIDKKGNIYLREQCIGFLADRDLAVVDSEALGSFANRWLMQHGYRVNWQEGVMQKLAQTVSAADGRVRVYQLRSDTPPALAQMNCDQVEQQYGGVDLHNYDCVYDGDLGVTDVRDAYAKLTLDPPQEYCGGALSMTDIIELCGPGGSRYFFVDEIGFRKINLGNQPVMSTAPMAQPAM